jgi:hypothetical protein
VIHGLDTGFLVAVEVSCHPDHAAARFLGSMLRKNGLAHDFGWVVNRVSCKPRETAQPVGLLRKSANPMGYPIIRRVGGRKAGGLDDTCPCAIRTPAGAMG